MAMAGEAIISHNPLPAATVSLCLSTEGTMSRFYTHNMVFIQAVYGMYMHNVHIMQIY